MSLNVNDAVKPIMSHLALSTGVGLNNFFLLVLSLWLVPVSCVSAAGDQAESVFLSGTEGLVKA